ncbi:WecB/TagA/CpsF family glycosyltransferase [Paraclostridium sordellii]|uniref:WecB/TagA/CpsF family glycosyl transferase n=1 Tax=Paraclostridium sordellii TaxID=1505 RepID=A0A9P1L5W7_PARSO|nr:WecB/TagA/CpsF family glycosyltransferase [Paeniclostridium sordellii]AUN15514.1 glycosyltransferase [Paeniclostridium sordellii]MDU5020162.1 WecB/TagA/CpsF family glycosyltransferase [Clostridiales bacterium]RGX14255.1 glycosyltransferase [Paeniclostridium sordellii]CEO33980.1 WecB/TagA/CpsF family glycosyl transferase [[Clostridium] sordellii] [Paeniclostridium sordellii]
MIDYIKKTYRGTKEEFLKELEDKLLNEEKAFIVTANPETFMKADKSPEFDQILKNDETTIIADGIGVVKGASIINVDIKERIPGVEVSYGLLKLANKYKKSLYLLGANKEVIELTANKIRNEYSNINLLGYTDGYVSDKDKVFDEIVDLSPDIVLVALGVPAQEMLIGKHYDKFNKGIFVGVGGTFDVMSGTVKRAPRIFIKLNLEWLYRIAGDKTRMKRFYDSNIKFIFEIKKLSKENK